MLSRVAAVFITDLRIPGMVHAKLWRSPLPHARVRRIDTTAAAASPSVLAVLTADDFAAYDRYFGPAFKDQPMLDVDQGFADADHIFEYTFTFPMVHHYPMEPHVSIAQAEDDRITVWAATQHPFPARKELADMFKLPLARVEVIVPYLGGAYGNKSYTKFEPLTVAMSRTVGQPVRLAFSVEESFKIVRRAAARVRIKTGVKNEGTLVARHHCIAHYQIGAYADVGPRIVQKAGYRWRAVPHSAPPHRHACGVLEYCQQCRLPGLRGAAAGLGLRIADGHHGRAARPRCAGSAAAKSPASRRSLRARRSADRLRFSRRLKTAAEAIGWPEPAPSGHGLGLACVIKAPLAPSVSSAIVRLHADGSATILAGTIEFSRGARRVLCQIVAEELALPLAWVQLALPEFGMSPYDQATSSSRSTTLMGLALQTAARDIRDQLASMAAAQQQLPPECLKLRHGAVEGPEIRLPYTELLQTHFGMPGGELIGRGIYWGERGTPLGRVAPFWEVSLTAAEVSVDDTTGQVHLERYVSIADVGKAINPLQCEAQEEGGVVMGIGHTFFEQLVYEDGQLLNPGLIDYRIPVMSDLPSELRSILVENGDAPEPFGFKGIGESGLMPTSPAIANALARAVGVRLTDLPLTPERVHRALQAYRGLTPSPRR